MSTQFSATYVDGMIKPDQGLDLPDNSRIMVTVEIAPNTMSPQEAWESLQNHLKLHPINSGGEHFTRDQLNERD